MQKDPKKKKNSKSTNEQKREMPLPPLKVDRTGERHGGYSEGPRKEQQQQQRPKPEFKLPEVRLGRLSEEPRKEEKQKQQEQTPSTYERKMLSFRRS